MDIDHSKYTSLFSPRKTSARDELANEIVETLGKWDTRGTIKHGSIKNLITRLGVQATREIFTEVMKADFPHKVPLFWKKVKENYTKFATKEKVERVENDGRDLYFMCLAILMENKGYSRDRATEVLRG